MAEQWRILVVEDEENLNWNIVNSLQKDGYLVLGVTDGAEAIRTLWSEEYDIVICDQQMPDADGFDLLQWMRTYCPNTRMVMLGTAGGLNRAQALEMGVTSYLENPQDIRALKEELRRLLHQSGFSASLDSFDLLDVIQIINMSRKSIALVVNTGLEEQGTLRFQTGELIWAEYGTLRGEEAFFALAAHKNGTVVHRPWSEQITPNVTQPLSRLIFQALQYRSKYAERQQLSSEIEPIKSGGSVAGAVPDPPTLPPPPPTTPPGTLQGLDEVDDRPFQFAEEVDDRPFQVAEEVDDRPFQFVTENVTIEPPAAAAASAASSFAQLVRESPASGYLEQDGAGTMTRAEASGTKPPAVQERQWWEPPASPTGSFPRLQMSEGMRAITDAQSKQTPPASAAPIPPPTTVQKTGTNSLPSWLTDQPTNLGLPVLRGNTGQMPVTPKTPPTPTPAAPTPGKQESAQWPVPPQASLNLSDSGLRKMKPEDTSFTNSHRVLRQNATTPARPSGPLRPAPAEWQNPIPPSPPGQTGQIRSVRPASSPQHSGDTLQSLAALKKNSSAPVTPAVDSSALKNAPAPIKTTALPTWEPPANNAATTTETTGTTGTADTAGKRNYPALAAALQTLGYSVPGFLAAAVVSLEGMPIAQVAVDDADISPLCARLSAVAQGALQAMAEGNGEEYEHTVITSGTRHILLRLIGQKKEVFQALITLRETDPAQSLEVMANVEAALVAAL